MSQIDKYNLQISILQIIQKSYQYALAMMKYRAEFARQQAELDYYKGIYGEALSKPDAVRIAYTEGGLTPEIMEQLARENGIHIRPDAYGHNFFIYDAKDEDALNDIVARANTFGKKFFEENRFHETKEGFVCYATGEFVPHVHATGSYVDQEGTFHRGVFAEKETDEQIRDEILNRTVHENIVWQRNGNGNLVNEYGTVYAPVDGNGRYFDEKDSCVKLTEPAQHWYAMNEWGSPSGGMEYTMTPMGNMIDAGGRVLELPNEYGDVMHEDGTIELNPQYHGYEEARKHSLEERVLKSQSDKDSYILDEDYNFVSDNRKIPFRFLNGNYYENGELHKSDAFLHSQEREKEYRFDENGNLRSTDGEVTIPLYNQQGDYIDNDGNFHFNPEVRYLGNRRNELLKQSAVRSDDDRTYIFTDKGNFVLKDAVPGEDGNYLEDDILIRYHEDGSHIEEKTGYCRFAGWVYDSRANNGRIYERCPGGYRNEATGDMIRSYNEYGDYYSPEAGTVILNTGFLGNEEARTHRVLAEELNPINNGFSYIVVGSGRMENIEDGSVIFVRNALGEQIYEHADDEQETSKDGPSKEDDDNRENPDDEPMEPEREKEPEEEDREGKKEEGQEETGEEQEEDAPAEELAEEPDEKRKKKRKRSQHQAQADAAEGQETSEPVPEVYDDQIEEPSDGLIVSDITSSGSATAAMEESVPSETVSAGTSDTADPAAGASFTAVFENGTSAADVEAGTTATSKDNTGTDGEDKVSEIFQTEDAKRDADRQATAEHIEAARRREALENFWGAPVYTDNYGESSHQDTLESHHTSTEKTSETTRQQTGPGQNAEGTRAADAAAAFWNGSNYAAQNGASKSEAGQQKENLFTNPDTSFSFGKHDSGMFGGHGSKPASDQQNTGASWKNAEAKYSFGGNATTSHTGSAPRAGQHFSGSASPDGDGRKVERNTMNLNRDALHRSAGENTGHRAMAEKYGYATAGEMAKKAKADAEYRAKAEKFGFANMTAQKKYGFHSMAPVTGQVEKPSTDGIIGAIGRAALMPARSTAQQDLGQVGRVTMSAYRTIGASLTMVGGTILAKSAMTKSRDYFQKLQKADKLNVIDGVLKRNGLQSAKFGTAKDLRQTSQSLIKLGQKSGFVTKDMKLKNVAIADFRKAGLVSAGDISIFKNAMTEAIRFQKGYGMMRHGGRTLSYIVKYGAQGNDPSIRALGMGMDTVRVTADLAVSAKRAADSRVLRRHLKYKENEKLLAQNADNPFLKIGSKNFKKQNIQHFRSRPGAPKVDPSLNAEAVRKYEELRKLEEAKKWNKAHRRSEKHFQKVTDKRRRRLEKVNALKAKGNALKQQALRPFNAAGTAAKEALRNSRVGRAVTAANNKIKAMKAYKFVKKDLAEAKMIVTKFIERAADLGKALMKKLMIFLAVYVLVAIAICVLAVAILIPVSMAISAETNDDEIMGTLMDDVYDKSNTLTGIIYNELRYMEVEWANETRSYGTSAWEAEEDYILDFLSEPQPLSLFQMQFTEYNISPKQYALSQTGKDDLLGTWAYDSSREEEHIFGEDTAYEGILGPEPFEGASPEDYKLLRFIDGGNNLELRGKPQEGYTSNAKQITAMASVFFNQEVETLKEQASGNGLQGLVAKAKYFWRAAWTWLEKNDIPVFGWLAKQTGWSWTSVYRNYAYPLMQASHQENFFLSSYIFPTKYTFENHEARWDGAKGGDPLVNGDQSTKVDQETGQAAKNGKIGATTEGGSGKIDHDFNVSTEAYGGYGDADWEAIEMCPDEETYGGYGCQLRNRFYYKWTGEFGTDRDGNLTNGEIMKHLYYGGCPDEGAGAENVSDVSNEVSPFRSDEEAEHGYDELSCLVDILKIEEQNDNIDAPSPVDCWQVESSDPLTDYDFEEHTGLLNETFSYDGWNQEYLNRNGGGDTDSEDNLTIQKVETTEDGCDIYCSYPFDEIEIPDGIAPGVPEYKTDYTQDGIVYHFKHECVGRHKGVYCGGHLQLRTRGVVYGFSKEQEEEGTVAQEGTISAFAPKNLDPVKYKDPNFYADAENRDPNKDDVAQLEKDAYPELDVWKIDEHCTDGYDAAYIAEEDMKIFYNVKDLFDVDTLIKRRRTDYPGYGGNSEATGALGDNTAMSKWTGWTLTNMGNAVTIASGDWFEQYALADTQTASGGIFDPSAGAKLNAASDSLITHIQELLIGGLPLDADILDPEAKGYDGELLTDEEKKSIDGARHALYALNSVGKVSYSQNAHANQYGNVKGKATDCSGFVCNIWRDVFEAPLTVSAMAHGEQCAPYIHPYTGIGTAGIEPGDIILKMGGDDGADHSLIYIGTFDKAELYSILYRDGEIPEDLEGAGERVFTVDCSSMVLTLDDLPSQDDVPLHSLFPDNEGDGKLSVKDYYKQENRLGKEIMVRSGNVRFCDREYCNNPNGAEMYYIDMSEMEKIGQRQLFHDFTDLGDSVSTDFWERDEIRSDLTQVREPIDIRYPDYIFSEGGNNLRPPVEDVEIPDEELPPIEDHPSVEGIHRIDINYSQYINQGNSEWSQLKRGGIGTNSTIGNSGCIDCSYLMAAQYLNDRRYDVGRVLTNPDYYSGNSFMAGPFLNDFGLKETRTSFSMQTVRNAIDEGNPVMLDIHGVFPNFHSSPRDHHLLIIGYSDEGILVYDPGSFANTYDSGSHKIISYETLNNGPGSIEGIRVISKR